METSRPTCITAALILIGLLMVRNCSMRPSRAAKMAKEAPSSTLQPPLPQGIFNSAHVVRVEALHQGPHLGIAPGFEKHFELEQLQFRFRDTVAMSESAKSSSKSAILSRPVSLIDRWTAHSMVAARRPSMEPKWCVTRVWLTPAREATARYVTPRQAFLADDVDHRGQQGIAPVSVGQRGLTADSCTESSSSDRLGKSIDR